MPTQAKRENIDMLCEALKKSDAVIIVEYRGLTVKKISEVRRLIRKAGGEMKVSKNTLMRIALQECGMVQAPEYDFGPNGYVISYGDAAAVAKAVRDFAKEKGNEALVVKGAILGGQQVLNQQQVFALADLPSKDQLISASRTRHGPFRPAEKLRHCPFSDQGQEGGDRRVVCAERFSQFPREREREAA